MRKKPTYCACTQSRQERPLPKGGGLGSRLEHAAPLPKEVLQHTTFSAERCTWAQQQHVRHQDLSDGGRGSTSNHKARNTKKGVKCTVRHHVEKDWRAGTSVRGGRGALAEDKWKPGAQHHPKGRPHWGTPGVHVGQLLIHECTLQLLVLLQLSHVGRAYSTNLNYARTVTSTGAVSDAWSSSACERRVRFRPQVRIRGNPLLLTPWRRAGYLRKSILCFIAAHDLSKGAFVH